MYLTNQMISQMESLYGVPEERSFRMEAPEFDFIRSTQTHGRNHDITIYMAKENQVAVIAKHFYPKGLFRAPSGGLKPGESFEVGVDREMAEEIGCEIKLERFLLRTAVDFVREGSVEPVDEKDVIHWRSFVFLASYVSGDFGFTDKREIRETKLADWSEFAGFCQTMRGLNKGGFHYRAALHEAVAEVLGKR